MRVKMRWLAVVAALGLARGAGAQGVTLSLGEALSLAHRNSRVIGVARARVEEARGDLLGAGVLLRENPEFDLSLGPRRPGDGVGAMTTSAEAGLTQRFEVAGQRGHRVDRAQKGVAAAEADSADVMRAVDLAVASAYIEALAANERVQICQEDEQLSQDLLVIATARVKAGADLSMDANAARLRLAQSRARTLTALADRQAALITLAEMIGVPTTSPPEPGGSLSPVPRDLPPLDDLVARARSARPDVQATEAREAGARAQEQLANAQAWPDVSLGVAYGRDDRSDLFLARVGFPVPLFQRSQGERARAAAEARRTGLEVERAREAAEADVRREYAAWHHAVEALRIYDADVIRAQRENMDLVRQAFAAGKVGYAAVMLLQREGLDARASWVDVRRGATLAELRLRLAAGLSLAGGEE